MKKVCWMLLITLLLACSAPFSSLVTAEETLPDLWDGSTADGFAGGDGSESDPFRIETAAQFSYFAKSVQLGETYSDKHVKLCADIRLNDETFTFDPDTGLVKVSDGINTAYCGSDRRGDDSGSNTLFDTKASAIGIWYDQDGQKISAYPGKLHVFTSMYFFGGSFDGAGHKILGMHMYDNGLFATMDNGKLIGIHIENSFVMGNQYVGGILGLSSKNTVVVKNCMFDGVVIGRSHVGGVAGNLKENALLSSCENRGVVIGTEYVGGIAGSCNWLEYCLNRGCVRGDSSVGGLAGKGSMAYCTNTGIVEGNTHTGGICGVIQNSASYCHNLGPVKGGYRTGGIVGGYKSQNTSAFHCYNNAPVQGNNYVGGIMGVGCAEGCRNEGTIAGNDYVGGITGNANASKCRNDGTVSGASYVGGVVGYGYADTVCNYGKVIGHNFVGGVVGRGVSGIYNCYNQGDISGKEFVGGLIGYAQRPVHDGYNTGKVLGENSVGALIGAKDEQITVRQLYYLENSAYNTEADVQTGVGNTHDYMASEIRACTEEEMKIAQNILIFNYITEWEREIPDQYPTLKLINRFVNEHNEEKASEQDLYLCTPVACDVIPLYRTSCGCGAVMGTVFEGEKKSHYPSDGKWLANLTAHFQICGRCHEHIMEQSHVYKEIKTVQNGMVPEVIVSCETCGYASHIPFEYQEQAVQPSAPTPPKTSEKAEFTFDARFVLLLTAGIVLGAVGTYGVNTVCELRRKQKNKKKNFI